MIAKLFAMAFASAVGLVVAGVLLGQGQLLAGDLLAAAATAPLVVIVSMLDSCRRRVERLERLIDRLTG